MKLTDMKIRTKIMLAVLFAGLVGLAVSIFGSGQLNEVDANYAAMVASRPKAILASARASRTANNLIAQTYKIIAYPLGSPAIAQAKADATRSYEQTIKYLEEAASLLPDQKSAFDSIVATAKALQTGMNEAVTLGERDENDKALAVMDTLDGKLAALVRSITDLNNAVLKATDETSAQLTAASSRASALMLGTAAAGLVLGLIGAAVLASMTITGPLQRLKTAMGELAQGKLDTEVLGGSRKDEIGDMARAVMVFKENGMEMRQMAVEKAERDRQAEADRVQRDAERQRDEAERRKLAEQQHLVVTMLAGGLDRLAQGDLTCRLTDDVAAEYEKLRLDFNRAIEGLAETVITIQSTSVDVGNAAREIDMGPTICRSAPRSRPRPLRRRPRPPNSSQPRLRLPPWPRDRPSPSHRRPVQSRRRAARS